MFQPWHRDLPRRCCLNYRRAIVWQAEVTIFCNVVKEELESIRRVTPFLFKVLAQFIGDGSSPQELYSDIVDASLITAAYMHTQFLRVGGMGVGLRPFAGMWFSSEGVTACAEYSGTFP